MESFLGGTSSRISSKGHVVDLYSGSDGEAHKFVVLLDAVLAAHEVLPSLFILSFLFSSTLFCFMVTLSHNYIHLLYPLVPYIRVINIVIIFLPKSLFIFPLLFLISFYFFFLFFVNILLQDWVYSVAWHPRMRDAEDNVHQPMRLLTASMDRTMILWEVR